MNDEHKFVIVFAVAAFAFFAATAILKERRHQHDLEEHGCQEYYRAKTGQTRMAGKMFQRETLHVYECASGKRTELTWE